MRHQPKQRIELSEVTYHTSKAPNGKAAGTDSITAEALKTSFGVTFYL